MTNLLRLALIIILFVGPYLVNAQVGTGLENSLGLNIGNLRNGAGIKTVGSKVGPSIDGSSLLLDSNFAGKIKFINGQFSQVVTLNYDLLNGATIVYTPKENYTIASDVVSEIILVGINTEEVVKYKVVDLEGQYAIMEVLVDGEFGLLKEHSAKLLKPVYNQALDTGEKSYRVSKKSRYFVVTDHVKFHPLPKKSKTLFKKQILPNEMKSALRKAEYSLKKEESLVEFFQLINKI